MFHDGVLTLRRTKVSSTYTNCRAERHSLTKQLACSLKCGRGGDWTPQLISPPSPDGEGVVGGRPRAPGASLVCRANPTARSILGWHNADRFLGRRLLQPRAPMTGTRGSCAAIVIPSIRRAIAYVGAQSFHDHSRCCLFKLYFKILPSIKIY